MTGSQVVRCLGFVSLLIGVSSGSSAAPIFTFTTIDYPGANGTVANTINNAGQIVGNFSGPHGFLKDVEIFTTIDVPGSTRTSAIGINNAGQIVGSFDDALFMPHGFLKDGATFTIIDYPGILAFTNATGINDAGQIVGSFSGAARDNSFLKDGEVFTTIDVPGSTRTLAIGINDAGQIVGSFDDASFRTHGFLKDGAIFTTIDVPGAIVTQAFGINDAGQIVGYFSDVERSHGFVASPDGGIPEPATWLKLGSGLMGLVWWRQRHRRKPQAVLSARMIPPAHLPDVSILYR